MCLWQAASDGSSKKKKKTTGGANVACKVLLLDGSELELPVPVGFMLSFMLHFFEYSVHVNIIVSEDMMNI